MARGRPLTLRGSLRRVRIACTRSPEGGVFTADMPKMFGSRVQAAVTADARVINLHELCPHFFVFGKTLARQ